MIEVSGRHTQFVNGYIINKRWQYRDNHQYQTCQVFSKNNFDISNWFCEQHFHGAGFVLFGKRPHSNGRNKEKENPGREHKKVIDAGVSIVEDIEL